MFKEEENRIKSIGKEHRCLVENKLNELKIEGVEFKFDYEMYKGMFEDYIIHGRYIVFDEKSEIIQDGYYYDENSMLFDYDFIDLLVLYIYVKKQVNIIKNTINNEFKDKKIDVIIDIRQVIKEDMYGFKLMTSFFIIEEKNNEK